MMRIILYKSYPPGIGIYLEAPFRQLPEDFPEDYLEITFGFYYLLPGDEKRFFKQKE